MDHELSPEAQQKLAEYHRHMHAMQSGVAMKMNHDGGPATGETSPKHLRVGVNAAMRDHSSLAHLLIKKGVITLDEYIEAITAGAKAEKEMYERTLRDRFGGNTEIRLG